MSVHRCNYYVGGTWTSDWNFHIIPFRSFNHLMAGNPVSMEIEIESCDVYPFVNRDDRGQPGDLFVAIGRWIIDCGHSPPLSVRSSEIHPPAILANVHTEADNSGKPATVATLFVNGYYTSGETTGIDIFPPPRPAPNAIMTIKKPVDALAAADLQVNWLTDPDWSSFVRVNFSAQTVAPSVFYGGRMDPMAGRRYYGPWTVGWAIDPRYQVSFYDY